MSGPDNVPEDKFCPSCGKLNREKARFCDQCSEALSVFATRKITIIGDRYEIIQVIKSGGMGCVYKAKDTRLGGVVAVKKMLSAYSKEEDRKYVRERFRQEAKILSTLSHPGLPKVTDFFVSKDVEIDETAHYLVMTFIKGKDLETLINKLNGGLFPIDVTVSYTKQILLILNYLHTQSPPVIYRDVKPSNIMIAKDNAYPESEKVYLVDFGLARTIQPKVRGTIIGTPGYAAPEQYKGYAEPRSDLYSLGVMMSYMLTGKDPEDPSIPPFSLNKKISDEDSIPDHIKALLKRMLDMDIEKRPSSAREILDHLEQPGTIIEVNEEDEIVEEVQEENLDINHPYGLWQKFSVLEESIMGRPEIAPIRHPNKKPLHVAAEKGDTAVIINLLNNGADVNETDNDRWTPLHYAAIFGKPEAASLLLDRDARINALDDEHKTPLYRALAFDSNHVAALLVSRGADLGIPADNGWTPLHLAVYNHQKDMVELLVKNGALVNATDKRGRTPLDMAIKTGRIDIIQYLKEKGAKKSAWWKFF